MPEDAASEREALAEVLKVLINPGLRETQLVKRNDRAEGLRGMGQKKVEQQLKPLERSRGAYDPILGGPEVDFSPDAMVLGVSGRHMSPHIQRGHFHPYRCGKGRTQTVTKFLQPILVRKDLLGDGAGDPTAPKDYDLK